MFVLDILVLNKQKKKKSSVHNTVLSVLDTRFSVQLSRVIIHVIPTNLKQVFLPR